MRIPGTIPGFRPGGEGFLRHLLAQVVWHTLYTFSPRVPGIFQVTIYDSQLVRNSVTRLPSALHEGTKVPVFFFYRNKKQNITNSMSRNKIFLLIKLFIIVIEFLFQILYSDFHIDRNNLTLNYLGTNVTIFISSLKCRQQLTIMWYGEYSNMLAKKRQTLQKYLHGCRKFAAMVVIATFQLYLLISDNHKPIVILSLLWFQSEYSWNQIFQFMNYAKFLFSIYMWDGSQVAIFNAINISRIYQVLDAQNIIKRNILIL